MLPRKVPLHTPAPLLPTQGATVLRLGLPLEIASQLKLTEEQKTLLEKQYKARSTGRQNSRQQGGGGFGGPPNN